jgi:heterotetrameric sarcosine oxidase gamma subunit
MTQAMQLTEQPLAAAIEVRGDGPGALSAAGLGVPTAANTMWRDDNCRVLWLGRDCWLVLAPLEREATLRDVLESAGHAVNLSDSLLRFELIGAGAADVLAQGSALDFDRFGPPACARTALGRIAVILLRTDEGFDILVDRAYRSYFLSWLARATGG